MTTLVQISRTLAREAGNLSFSKETAYVYNPLEYAKVPHEAYLNRYGKGKKEVVLLGMNPGPFGMMQTGVPFGDIFMVRDFLKIEGKVTPPEDQHPKRPVDGFACQRSEVSGTRLWGFVKERFKTPGAFFERFFVANYCPLVFLEPGGKNRTPDKLGRKERDALFSICDDALRKTVAVTGARTVIGIGAFALGRIKVALRESPPAFGMILHPSPASPSANRGWAPQAEKQLQDLGLL